MKLPYCVWLLTLRNQEYSMWNVDVKLIEIDAYISEHLVLPHCTLGTMD